jgi:hypothetical protein
MVIFNSYVKLPEEVMFMEGKEGLTFVGSGVIR